MNKGERIKTTRPIDAFALKCAIEKRIDEITNEDFAEGMLEAIVEIECQPTVDAIPVIWCKDCKYYLTSDEECQLINTRLHFYEENKKWTKESFCSWARRREE